jgi:hypothetical protein
VSSSEHRSRSTHRDGERRLQMLRLGYGIRRRRSRISDVDRTRIGCGGAHGFSEAAEGSSSFIEGRSHCWLVSLNQAGISPSAAG